MSMIAQLIIVLWMFIALGGIPQQKYNRADYPHWIDADSDCQDTRQEVLIRDALAFALSADGCAVTQGIWKDPYSGETFTNPKDLDVDHLVPLENADRSGAHAWSKEEKKAYANDLDYRLHLIAVSASENRKKGSKGPEAYLPPNQEYRCSYAQVWASVKMSWGLTATELERNALRETLKGCK